MHTRMPPYQTQLSNTHTHMYTNISPRAPLCFFSKSTQNVSNHLEGHTPTQLKQTTTHTHTQTISPSDTPCNYNTCNCLTCQLLPALFSLSTNLCLALKNTHSTQLKHTSSHIHTNTLCNYKDAIASPCQLVPALSFSSHTCFIFSSLLFSS